MNSHYPKFAIAFSGAAARSAFYVGFLEVLSQKKLQPNIITAQSGASIVATAYACGRLEHLKNEMLNSKSKLLLSARQKSGNGSAYSLDPFEEHMREYYTDGRNFEELTTKLCFVATDLATGEDVPLCTGDVARACRITCTVPGIFEPYKWGTKVLVDGGLSSFIPSEHARLLGADVVIGVNVRATKHIFPAMHIKLWQGWQILRVPLNPAYILSRQIKKLVNLSWFNSSDSEADTINVVPNMFSVLRQSLDIAVAATKKTNLNESTNHGCDLLISEGIGRFGQAFKFTSMAEIYRNGRKTAQEKLKAIEQSISSGQPFNLEKFAGQTVI